MRFRNVHKADPQLFLRVKKDLLGPALFFSHGLLFKQRQRRCFGERAILPFSSEDGQAAAIFGATDFKLAFLYRSGPETCGEVEHWFDLTAPMGSLSTEPSESARHLTSELAEVS